MRPLKVLVGAIRTGRSAQGNAVYTRALVEGLSREPDIDLVVVASKSERRDWTGMETSAVLHEVSLPPYPVSLLLEQMVFAKWIKSENPDLFHSPNTLLPFWRPRCSTVVTVHDLNYLSVSQGVARNCYKRFLYSYAATHADKIIAVSEFTARQLVAKYPAAELRTEVIWEGQPYLRPADRSTPRESSSVDAEPYLLTFAHQPHKNAEAAIQVLRLVREQRPSIRLKVFGEGKYVQRVIEPLVRKLELTTSVEFLGWVSQSELQELYRGALGLLFMSYYEGFGLPAIEAMALGCPVVASDRAALPEIVGEYGCVVDADEWQAASRYVLRLLADAEWAQGVRNRARRYAARWTWDRMVGKTVDLYRELARGESRSN